MCLQVKISANIANVYYYDLYSTAEQQAKIILDEINQNTRYYQCTFDCKWNTNNSKDNPALNMIKLCIKLKDSFPEIFIFHICQFGERIPEYLQKLLTHERIILYGYKVGQDLIKLKKVNINIKIIDIANRFNLQPLAVVCKNLLKFELIEYHLFIDWTRILNQIEIKFAAESVLAVYIISQKCKK